MQSPAVRLPPPFPPTPSAAVWRPRTGTGDSGSGDDGRRLTPSPLPPASQPGRPRAAAPRLRSRRDDGSRHAAALLLPLRAAVRGLHHAPRAPAAPRGPAPRRAPRPPPPGPHRRSSASPDLPQLLTALAPHLQLRTLPCTPGQARGAHLQVLPGQPWPCLPVQLGG